MTSHDEPVRHAPIDPRPEYKQGFPETAIISLNADFFESINFESFESCLSSTRPVKPMGSSKQEATVAVATPLEYQTAPAAAVDFLADTVDLDLLSMDSIFRQSSVLDTPPVFDLATAPGFPNYHDALSSMESGLFNDIPALDSIMESTNVVSSVLDIGPQFAMAGLNPEPAQAQATAAPMEAVAAHVQFDYHPDMLLETKNEGVVINDQPMPIVRATSHDHAYVNNDNEDYQILRDFLNMGQEMGVVGDSDDEELNAIISDFDFGQLAPRTCYMDTYGDLTQMLHTGPEEEEDQSQSGDLAPEVQEMQEQESIQSDEPSVSTTVYQFEEPSTSTQFDYAPSPASESVCSTPSVIPKSRKSRTKGVSSGLVKDQKYWERRQKNNVASARSRQTRKERAKETELEREQLEIRNRHLKQEIAQLTRMVDEHKRKFFSAFKK